MANETAVKEKREIYNNIELFGDHSIEDLRTEFNKLHSWNDDIISDMSFDEFSKNYGKITVVWWDAPSSFIQITLPKYTNKEGVPVCESLNGWATKALCTAVQTIKIEEKSNDNYPKNS